jgi:hypothetical protein
MTHRLTRLCAATLCATLIATPCGAFAADTQPPASDPRSTTALNGPAPAATGAAPTYGDLTHLDFTATGDLSAKLVSPTDGGPAGGLAAIFDVATVAGAGVEIKIDDVLVAYSHIGKRTVDNKTGETHYFYYGVPLQEGPNRVALTPLGANGARGKTIFASVFGPGKPQRLRAAIQGQARADGASPFVLHVSAFDRWGNPAAAGTSVRVAIVGGDARFETHPHPAPANPTLPTDVFPEAPTPVGGESHDLPLQPVPAPSGVVPAANGAMYDNSSLQPQPNEAQNFRPVGDRNATTQDTDATIGSGGTADVVLIPGLRPGDLTVRVSYEDVRADARTFVSPALRKPMVVGLATAGVGSVPGVPGEQANVPDGADSRRGRIAIYGVGQITKTAQATLAYDTASVLDETSGYGSFTDNPDARPYLTYGDSSLRRDDALSRDHLYARVDSGRSSAMWGEFVADSAGNNALGGFQQLVSGAKVEIAGNNAKLVAFQARNDIAYARQVFTPTGLANIGSLLNPDIVVGSDTITLVSLDRHTGAIVEQTVLTRNVDYTLDYSSGFLHFLNPPLPFDIYFNPQEVLVQYEYGGSGVNAETTGGRAEVDLGASKSIKIGAGYVNDATGSGNLNVIGQDITGTLAGGSWSIAHLGTHGSADSGSLAVPQLGLAGSADGDAYKASLLTAVGPTKLDLGFETTSVGFDNPFGGLSSPGLLDYHTNVTRAFSNGGSITASLEHDQNNVPGYASSQTDASLHARAPVTKRFTVTAGVDFRSSSSYTSSGVPSALAGTQAVDPVPTPVPQTAAQVYRNPGGGVTQGQLGFEYKLNNQIKVQASRVQNIGANTNAANPGETAAEVDVDFPKKGRVYVRQLWTDASTEPLAASTSPLTDLSGAHSSTSVGIERAVGAATTIDSDYVIDRTASGTDAYAEMGVRERLNISNNLKGEATLQRAADFGGTGSDANGAGAFDLYGVSLAYSLARFHATTQYQIRTGSAAGYTLDVAAAGELSPDFSAFVTANSSSSGSGFSNVDDRATVAFRPSENDRGVTLFSYERQDGNVSELGTHAEVLSLEELYRPTHMTEIAARYAYKLDGDSYYPARSSLFGIRLDQRLTRRFDVAAETRRLEVEGIGGASATGFAVEGGYRLGNEMRVAAGYNFAGSPDPNLVAAPTRKGVYGTVTSVIDNIFGWGKSSY